jgi:hypothetical protein
VRGDTRHVVLLFVEFSPDLFVNTNPAEGARGNVSRPTESTGRAQPCPAGQVARSRRSAAVSSSRTEA